jgi:hypothetical protein
MTDEKPFIEKIAVDMVYLYNPNYGDDRLCVCGHPYYRHFDTYDEMRNVGCKYAGSCGCEGFKEKE